MKKYFSIWILLSLIAYQPTIAQDISWLDGTWIGIGYQLNIKDTWRIVLQASPSQSYFTIEYPSLYCSGEWELLHRGDHKATFQEKITQGSNACISGRKIVITYISEEYVTYSCFDADHEELDSYATLVRVDEEKFALNEVKIENNSCENLYLDLEKGTLNGLRVNASQKEIKKALPCFTGDSPDGSEFNCGGGVFFLDHDFYFYSGQNYIEVRENFTGSISDDIMNKSTAEIAKLLGEPDRTESIRKWDGSNRLHFFYQRPYGCISMVFVKKKLAKIAIHSTPINETQLCY